MIPTPHTRIQRRNYRLILDAALEVFAQHGFRGSTLDQIAAQAGLSKPNLFYYFSGKDEIHRALLTEVLDTWLDPLRALDPAGDPQTELRAYVRRKLAMSREMPRESRLFANEILQGAPRIEGFIRTELKALVDEKAGVIQGWARSGRIPDLDPWHLIFSIWALTQNYADFEAQMRLVRGPDRDPFDGAQSFLDHLFERLLAPEPRQRIGRDG
jgi:TetR/AcrR family transcriptional regulator